MLAIFVAVGSVEPSGWLRCPDFVVPWFFVRSLWRLRLLCTLSCVLSVWGQGTLKHYYLPCLPYLTLPYPNLTIYLSTYLPIYLSTYLPINQSSKQSVSQSINQASNQSNPLCLSVCRSVYLSLSLYI